MARVIRWLHTFSRELSAIWLYRAACGEGRGVRTEPGCRPALVQCYCLPAPSARPAPCATHRGMERPLSPHSTPSVPSVLTPRAALLGRFPAVWSQVLRAKSGQFEEAAVVLWASRRTAAAKLSRAFRQAPPPFLPLTSHRHIHPCCVSSCSCLLPLPAVAMRRRWQHVSL